MTTLKETSIQPFDFFEKTPALVCIASKDGYLKRINPAVIEKLGYTEEELLSHPIFTFIHPDDREETILRRARLLEGQVMLNFENRYLKKNGEVVWLQWTSIYVPEDEVVFAIAKDVTERKLAEKEIETRYSEFKTLATHFKQTIEKDRKFLAAELHEELAQLASVVKMDLDWINTHSNLPEEKSRERLGHALAMTSLLISTIRRISFSISPTMLDDLGLTATMEWLCKEFSLLNGIQCRLETEYDESDLPKEIWIDFFRICQEALANAMFHAAANNVSIRIEDTGTHISLSITDDGKGFSLEEEKNVNGLGLMRKRAASIHGQFSIESTPGKGTKVVVKVGKYGRTEES